MPPRSPTPTTRPSTTGCWRACRGRWTAWPPNGASRFSDKGLQMRLSRSIVVDAEPHLVWKHVSDPGCYPEFMANLERWEIVTDTPAGVGARYTVHWKVGSVPIGGVIEVSEFDEPRDLAWIGITGITL